MTEMELRNMAADIMERTARQFREERISMHEMAVRLRMADGEIHALVEKFVAEPQAA